MINILMVLISVFAGCLISFVFILKSLIKKKQRKIIKIILLVIIGTVMTGITLFSFNLYYTFSRVASEDPLVWKAEIEAFAKQDRKQAPRPGAIVFVGSSSIRKWETLEKDMAPLHVIKRGFGGAKVNDVIYYANKIIIPYNPSAVVIYAGDNDFNDVMDTPQTPSQVLAAVKQLCSKIQEELPGTPIYYLSIKPSKLRLKDWPAMKKANQLIEAYMEKDERLIFIDVSSAMFDLKGNLKKDIFLWDGLHLNQKGYAIWTSIIKPILEKDLL